MYPAHTALNTEAHQIPINEYLHDWAAVLSPGPSLETNYKGQTFVHTLSLPVRFHTDTDTDTDKSIMRTFLIVSIGSVLIKVVVALCDA